MSQWEYEAGRKICLQNMSEGDFSNGTEPKTEEERQRLIQYAKDELKRLEEKR